MKTTFLLVTAIALTAVLMGCGKNNKGPEQQTTPPSTSAASQVSPPQDFVAADQEPTVIKKVEPVYPELARKAGLEGKVWVKIWVDTAGKPRDVVILKSDSDIFNQVSIDAAKQFLFTPAYVKDKPVSVWVSVPFKFALSDKSGSKPEAVRGPASPTEASFMRGYIAAKEDAVSAMEKEAATAGKNGTPDAALKQKIQKAKAEIQTLKEALRAMQGTK